MPQSSHTRRRSYTDWLLVTCLGLLGVGLTVSLAWGYQQEPRAHSSTSANTSQTQHTVVPKEENHLGPASVVDRFFVDEVWSKLGERVCLKCHQAGGDASAIDFILHDPSSDRTKRLEVLRQNYIAFQRMAAAKHKGQSRLLLKATGHLEHEGGEILKKDSTGYQILKEFVRRINHPQRKDRERDAQIAANMPAFFDSIEMMPPRRLLRRVTLSLAGRLPTDTELALVHREGLSAIRRILDDVMQQDAFYERLQEAFNDILLTRGYDGSGELALSYEHFKNRLWYQQRDPRKGLSPEEAKKLPYSHPKMKVYTKLIGDYREGMRREPLELVEHIVRNDLPFTQIVTADYIMVSPYTARGYGIYEGLQDKFVDPDDPFEFITTKIESLKLRNGKPAQESPTGFYPHAGLLSSFQYLKRYPTTETNRNRLRIRMYFEHFLGIDLLSLAPQVSDAAAITATYEIPTMQASDCVVCHKVMDPIAGLYQDFYVLDGKGIYGPRKEGWYEDMFSPGFNGESIPQAEQWRSLQWLGERTASDPRFAVAMVKHVWYILMGRKPMLPPEDIDDPFFTAHRRAYRAQQAEIERITDKFIQGNFNLKIAFQELVQSNFYRAEGLAATVDDPQRLAEIDDIGLARLLTPEQLERKLTAIFGRKWGRLTDPESKFKILYGGIDSKEVTQRLSDPSGTMGAIQRILANDIACKNVASDFALPASERRLFPEIEIDIIPGVNRAADEQIRRAIVHLHELILGRFDSVNDSQVTRTFDLFSNIITDSKSRTDISKVESYSCQTLADKTPRDADPDYSIRAWRGVVTYLLRQHEFLYE